MQILNAFYGGMLLFVIICALTGMVAPSLARDLTKRIFISLLLFIGCELVWPSPGAGGLSGSFQLVLSFVLFLLSVLYLLHPALVLAIAVKTGGIAALVILFCLGVAGLWMTTSGRGLLLVTGVALGAILKLKKSGRL